MTKISIPGSDMDRQKIFQDWRRRNRDLEEALEDEMDCPDCEGAGELDCPFCGNVTDCERCDGTGKIIATNDEQMWNIFLEQVIRDRELYKKWCDAVREDVRSLL